MHIDTIPELSEQINKKNEAIQNSDAIFEELKDKLNSQEKRLNNDIN